jgi:predicted Zn-dependent protease with MMP-like domain
MTAPDELFARAHDALAASDLAAARRHAEAGLRACRKTGAPAEASVPGLYVLAAVHAEQVEDDEALALLAQIRALTDDHDDAAYLEAKLRLARWEFAAVNSLLGRWPEDDADPAVLHLRAVALELQGEQARADRLYARAAQLDPDNFPAPVRISDDDAHALLAETIERLPAPVVATFKNLSVDLLPVPVQTLHGDLDPEILGFYAGTPINELESGGMPLPSRIYIFKRNLERIAADHEELIEQLRITLLHELGHHLGLDEDDLDARGLG